MLSHIDSLASLMGSDESGSTERREKGAIDEFEMHYAKWPINKVDIGKLKVDYPRFAQLLKGSPGLAHYSPGVQVIAWDKKKNEKRPATNAIAR